MRIQHVILLATIPLLLVGCAATRPISDVAMGAGGAAIAHGLSDGNLAP